MRADSRSGDRQRNELRAAARARLLAAPSSPENDLAQDEHERFWRTHDTAAAPVAPAAPAVGLVTDYTVRLPVRFTVPAGTPDPEGVAATAVIRNGWLLPEGARLSEEEPLTVTGSVGAPAVWPGGTGPDPVPAAGAWCGVLFEVDRFGPAGADGVSGSEGPGAAEAAADRANTARGL